MAGQIALNKSGGGQLILSAPVGSTTETVTLPTSGFGKILQVQSYTYGARFTTASASMISTPLTVSITPTSTLSKIYVSVTCLLGSGSGSVSMQWQVRRNGTVVMPATTQALGSRSQAYMAYPNGDNNVTRTNTATYLDSPFSTSALSYTMYMKGQSGATAIMNGSYSNADTSAYGHVAASTITVMEVAG